MYAHASRWNEDFWKFRGNSRVLVRAIPLKGPRGINERSSYPAKSIYPAKKISVLSFNEGNERYLSI
jgi:hypothetical protein